MKVVISGKINVDGIWWDIDIERSVPDKASPDKKIAAIKAAIKGLAKAGIIPSSGVGGVVTNVNSPSMGNDLNPEPMSQQAALPLTPVCKTHRETMKESKVQREEGFVNFYCPQREGDGYCRQRAKINNEGTPSFWEVKEK